MWWTFFRVNLLISHTESMLMPGEFTGQISIRFLRTVCWVRIVMLNDATSVVENGCLEAMSLVFINVKIGGHGTIPYTWKIRPSFQIITLSSTLFERKWGIAQGDILPLIQYFVLMLVYPMKLLLAIDIFSMGILIGLWHKPIQNEDRWTFYCDRFLLSYWLKLSAICALLLARIWQENLDEVSVAYRQLISFLWLNTNNSPLSTNRGVS